MKRLPAAALALLAPALAAMAAPPLRAAVPGSAVVQEILDGDELYIESRRARVKDRARVPQQVRTGDSRGQLGFDTGAAGRLNRFSRIRLGSTCFLLQGGQILVSGRQSGCVRSARLSVRGTNYVIGLAADEAAEVIVLEGDLEVQRLVDGVPSDAPPTRLREATRARLAADGRVIAVERLTAAEVAALLAGPLFADYTTPLPDGEKLRQSIRRNWPGLSTTPPGDAPPSRALDAARDPLVISINAARVDNGRSPLKPLPPDLAVRNITYLQPVLVGILRSGVCDHDRSRWRAIQQEAAASYPLMPTSEVIACPRPTRRWNNDRLVARWLSSSKHRSILLERPRATHIGCLRADAGGRSVAICTLWSPTGPDSLTPR